MSPDFEIKLITESILARRRWEEVHFRLGRSSLAFDLMATVAHYTAVGSPLSLKQLFLLVEYSEAGARKQLVRLRKEGWIEIVRTESDARVRVVVALPKLLRILKLYRDVLETPLVSKINGPGEP